MSGVSKEGKKMLLNTIRIVEHQNKVKEEKKMWEIHKQRKKEEKLREKAARKGITRRKSDEKHKHKSKHKKDSSRKKKGKHRRRSPSSDEEKKPNYWMKKLYDAKQEDDNKWKHSGFKELYPEEFDSSSSDTEIVEVKRVKK